MSMSDPAAASADQPTPQEPLQPENPSVSAAPAQPEASAQVEELPRVLATEREVTLQRSVRVGRVIVGAAIAGALIAALLSFLFPVEEGADYTLGQVAGFAALIGAAIGLGVGGLLVMVLGAMAKRQRGTGIAIQSDVQ